MNKRITAAVAAGGLLIGSAGAAFLIPTLVAAEVNGVHPAGGHGFGGHGFRGQRPAGAPSGSSSSSTTTGSSTTS